MSHIDTWTMWEHIAAFIGGPIITCLIVFAFAKLMDWLGERE